MKLQIFHLEEFILDLAKEWEIGCFSADQFASRQLLQDIAREGIPTRYISVDRTDEAYIMIKTYTNAGLIDYCNNGLLKVELSNLRHIGNKVDHPADGCFVKDTKVIVSQDDKHFEYLTIGDLLNAYKCYSILSYNESVRQFEFVRIKKVFLTKYTDKLVHVLFTDSSDVICTPNHGFLTNDGYEEISNYPSNLVSYKNQEVEYIRDAHTYGPIPVYDIEVDSPNHNFCLGNGVVVHNSKDIADAVCGAVFSCYQDIDHASQLSTKYKAQSYATAIQHRATNYSDDAFQQQIQGLY